MSGVTNRTMRALYKPFGLGLTVTEFVSSNALKFGSRRTMEMIDQHGVERPVSTQLWGDDPATMARAARLVRECGADIVDINFGCPAPKGDKNQRRFGLPARSGSLRSDHACGRRCGRLPRNDEDAYGLDRDENSSTSTSPSARRRPERSGHAARAHGTQFYKGSADWDHIARLKRALDIPVIGNGDLNDATLAVERMRDSGVDGDHDRPRRARQSVADLADWRRDGGPAATRAAARSGSLRYCMVHYRAMVDEWANRAPFRRCANTSRCISRVCRVPPSFANGSCIWIARSTRSKRSKRRSSASKRSTSQREDRNDRRDRRRARGANL